MLDIEIRYFEENQQELLRQFPGRFVLVRGTDVIGSFDTLQDALSAGARQFGLSPFLIRRTDERPKEVSIPALTLGILRANAHVPIVGSGPNS